ncbi:MAG: DsbA family oxidoreductase [Betaproteobacteria bacterium]|nr:DsbA family oxidoreductase [Betaproteobacteria bacterium]
MKALSIEIISDVVCPWCFIGKRRLARAIEKLRATNPQIAPEISWRPFFLDAQTPVSGEPYRPYLERKFGGPERLDAIWRHIEEVGRGENIDFAFERIALRANTLLAHRLIHRVQAQRDASALVERLFSAHFTAGENLGDAAVLSRLASECGEDEAATRAYLVTDQDAEVVRELVAQSQRMGITGVPFFIFNGRVGVSGAQAPETLVQAMNEAN